MAAYPPGPTRMVDFPAYGANSAPTDRMWIASAAVGFAPGAAADRYITPNDFLAEITRNISDLTLQFGDGVSGTVSAAGKGKLRYNNTAGSFQVSENGGAYQNLLKGSGTATRVAFWSAADELSSDAALYWQNIDKRLGIGVGTTPDGPLDVLADGTALAQQWRQNGGSMRVQMIMDSVPEASLGTTTNHTFHLLTNNLQRLTVENGGLVGINKASLVQAQLQVVSQDATTETLILNSAASPSVNIAEFYNDNSLRFAFSPAANLGIGLSGAGGATGSITFNGVTSGAVTMTVAAAAGTWTLTLPTTAGSAGQFLQTNGAGVTTWATAGGGTPASPVNSVQFNNAGAFGGSSNMLWDNTNNRLLLGVTVASGQAPLDVLADGTALAQQWRQNGGSMRVQMIMDSVPEASLGTTTNHTFHLLTNNLQRLTIENGGLVGINKASLVQAQLQVVSQDATTETLILNSAASPSVNIAEFYNDNSLRFAFSPAANLGIGLSGAGGATGSITFNGVTSGAVNLTVAAAAGTWTLTLPTTDGNAGEFLQTDGAGVTTWAAAGGGTPGSPVNSVQFNNAGSFGGDSAFLWDSTNDRLLLGVAVASGQAPLDVLADGTALAQQWRQNGGSLRVQMILDNVPEGSLGTTTNHTFHLLSNNLQRLTVENGGLIGINKTAAVQAQLQVVSQDATTETLILNSAATPSVNIAEFYNDSSLRFAFSPAGNLGIGLSGAGGATGSITFNGVTSGAVTVNVAAAAGTWTLTLPTTDGNAGEFLQTDGAGVTTWAAAGGATINATDTVMPYRSSATAFSDSQLIRLSSAITELRNVAAGTTAQTLNIYGTAANNTASAPTEYVRANHNATSTAINMVAEIATPSTTAVAGINVNITASAAVAGASVVGAAAGGSVTITAGNAARLTSGNANGGSITLTTGTGIGTGTVGRVILTNNGAAGAIALQFGATQNGFYRGGNAGNAIVVTHNGSAFVTLADGNVGAAIVADTTRTIGWGTASSSTLDLTLRRSAAAHMTFGAADAASPVAQTLSVQNVVGGTSNTAGANWTFNASRGTGTGAGGALIWQVAPAGSSGTAQNALSSTMRLDSTQYLAVYTGTAPNVWTSGTRKAQLYLMADSLPSTGVVAYFSGTAADGPIWHLLRGRGTNASPTAVQNGDRLGTIEFAGHTSTGTNNFAIGGDIAVSATEAWSAGNNGSRMIFRVAPNAGTITERMSLENSGTLRVGATSGSFNTTTLVQVGNYASWNTDVVAAIYTGANGTKGLEIIGTSSATAAPLRVYRDSLTPDLLNLAASGVLSLRAGLNTSTIVANVGGTLDVNTTSVGNSSTTETDLMTYSVVANTEGTNGDYLRFECAGTFEASANNKRIRAYLGSTVLFDTTALAFAPATAVGWRLVVTIYRTSSAAQGWVAQFAAGGAVLTSDVQTGGGTEDFTTNLTFKLTGQGGASSEIFQDLMIAEWHPNN